MQCEIFDLGLSDFKQTCQYQQEIFQLVKEGKYKSALILCRHYPVITMGRLGQERSLRLSEEELKDRGLDLYRIERGGDVTYHGPGQLVIYPIFNLKFLYQDIHLFLRGLESVAIEALKVYGINAGRVAGKTGVWVGDEKIASIGISVKHWITFHGMSINVLKSDLSNFSLIRPCGMDIRMTSLESVLAKDVDMQELKSAVLRGFINNFQLQKEVCTCL